MDIIEKALNKKKSEKNNDNSVSLEGNVVNKKRSIEDTIVSDNELNLDRQNFVASSLISIDHKKKITQNSVEINKQYLSEQGIIVAENKKSLINEEFRRIKSPLLQNIKGKSAHLIERANVIQVTSSLQNEGKTFNAINLAMSFAMELDYRVLLVDADVLKPSVANTLNIKTDKGLIEYLAGEVEHLSDILLKTNIPKLTLLPAGQRHNLSVELFNSDVMINLFSELSERYSDRVVIIDSPPILLTNEAAILAQNVGQVVFVIERNITRIADVELAMSKLPDDIVIGVILNKSHASHSGYGYGYGYGSE
jgi:receptor protein-tyrosine kinase